MSDKSPVDILTDTIKDLASHVERLAQATARAEGAASEKAKVCEAHDKRLGVVEQAVTLLTTLTARHEERVKLLLWVQGVLATTSLGIVAKLVADAITRHP